MSSSQLQGVGGWSYIATTKEDSSIVGASLVSTGPFPRFTIEQWPSLMTIINNHSSNLHKLSGMNKVWI